MPCFEVVPPDFSSSVTATNESFHSATRTSVSLFKGEPDDVGTNDKKNEEERITQPSCDRQEAVSSVIAVLSLLLA